MKNLATAFLILIFALAATAGSLEISEEQIRADKEQIIKAELLKIDRIIGTDTALQSMLDGCRDPENDRDRNRGRDREPEVSPNCTYRGHDGNCVIYGADVRGKCVPNCTYRGHTGKCVIYGPDICE